MKDGKEIPADQLPVQMAAHGKEIRDYEFDLVFEDGTVHTILGDAVPLLDAEAHPYGAVGAFADITERKRIEGQFRRLIENSHDIIYTITTEGVFIFVSPAWTVLLGYPVSEVLGQSFQEFVHPDDIPSCLQWLQKVIETGQRQADIDYRVRHMDGYWRWFTSSAVPLRNEAGRVIGCEGIAKDITERRRVEDAKEKLEFQNRQLQKSESLGRMAGAIAHHFNNQLQAVMMNLQLAMDDLPQNLRSVEDLTDAMQSAHKAAEVSTLMLTYLGQTAARREPLDLSEVCQHHLPMLRAAMPQSVSLESHLAAPGPVIEANANQIQQILTNLLTNAWEAADETWGAVHLTVKTIAVEDITNINRYPIDCQTQGSAYACLKVADEGCGIADKDIEKVFDPFFSTKFTGRGLGLAVVLGIVRAHRGIITVQSRLGKGTVFRIFLPLSAKAIPKKPLQVAQGPKTAVSGTLLLVEDEPALRKAVTIALKQSGFTVYAAEDGVKAVEVFQQHRDEINCVISDLTMPRMNGWETLTVLRQLSPDIPVILCSGYSEELVMAGDHPELPQAFLGKPYELATLRDTIARFMRSPKASS